MNFIILGFSKNVLNLYLSFILFIVSLLYFYFKLNEKVNKYIKFVLYPLFLISTFLIIDRFFYFIFVKYEEIINIIIKNPEEILFFNFIVLLYAVSIILFIYTILDLKKPPIKQKISLNSQSNKDISIHSKNELSKEKFTQKKPPNNNILENIKIKNSKNSRESYNSDLSEINHLNQNFDNIVKLYKKQKYKDLIEHCIRFIENLFAYIAEKIGLSSNKSSFLYSYTKNLDQKNKFILISELENFIHFLTQKPKNFDSTESRAKEIFDLTKKILKKIALNNHKKLKKEAINTSAKGIEKNLPNLDMGITNKQNINQIDSYFMKLKEVINDLIKTEK